MISSLAAGSRAGPQAVSPDASAAVASALANVASAAVATAAAAAAATATNASAGAVPVAVGNPTLAAVASSANALAASLAAQLEVPGQAPLQATAASGGLQQAVRWDPVVPRSRLFSQPITAQGATAAFDPLPPEAVCPRQSGSNGRGRSGSNASGAESCAPSVVSYFLALLYRRAPRRPAGALCIGVTGL